MSPTDILIQDACLRSWLTGSKVIPAYDPERGDFVLRGERDKRVYGLDALTDLWECDPETAKQVTLAAGGIWSSLCDQYHHDPVLAAIALKNAPMAARPSKPQRASYMAQIL